MRARLLPVLATLLAACGGSTTDVPAEPGDAVETVAFDLPSLDVAYGEADAPAGMDAADVPAAEPGGDATAEAAAESGFQYACEPLTVEACTTACGSPGKRKCLKEWGPCMPPLESCGNCADDNCDGSIDEGCPPDPTCQPTTKDCPVAQIAVTGGVDAWTGDTLHLSGTGSHAKTGAIATYAWSVQAPAGAQGSFAPAPASPTPTFAVDAAGDYLFVLDVVDDSGRKSCVSAVVTVTVQTFPPQDPQVGCADGTREGFVDTKTYPQIAACSGAWEKPGVTPATVVPTCALAGGNSGANPSGTGCSAADLCAKSWHLCNGWQEVAQKSTTGCAGATPADAKPKSLFFAIRQPSKSNTVCGVDGDGYNDVFGCGNLGVGLGPDKGCGPLDRALASTQPNSCGFNEAEPPLGPWECKGGAGSDLNEGATVTKKACVGGTCSYDGAPVGSSDKGGVLCCRDPL